MSSLNETVVRPHFPASIETSIKDKNQQHHQQRSLPKGKIAKVEILSALNAAWKLYKLSPDTNVSILSGSETGSSGISANLMRNRKQLLSYCVAALSYIRVYSERNWKPNDIDKIVDIAWNINRRTVMKRPMNVKTDQQTEFEEKTDVFYIDSIKFVTLTKALTETGTIDKDDIVSTKDFFNLLLENGQQSCVVEFNSNFFAFWQSDDNYFIFQPMNVSQKSSKCVLLSSFDCVQLYLQKFFIDIQCTAKYVFHSVDFLKINDNILRPEEILKNFHQDTAGKVSAKSGDIPHKMCLLPTAHNPKATSFDEITEYKCILRCPKSIERSGKISSTCIAAIVVLRVIRAFLWTSDTLNDILALGSKIHKENLKSKSKDQSEIRVADITEKIQFGSFECLVESQQIFFGKVESNIANICNIEQGLTEFFMTHIAGVIDGPNVVAVFKEKDYYYMYDAKARNDLGLKLTKEESEAGGSGMSCVTRFQHLKDLVEIYIENVPKKERQDYYKITHIELKPFLGNNWHQWKVELAGQWCLRSEEYLQLKENLRVCVTALVYAENMDVKNWKVKTVDDILSTGQKGNDNFHGESNVKKMEMEILWKEKPTFATINRKMFRYVVNALDKNIEDCLVKGFSMFFETNKRGLFVFNTKKSWKWKYFSIWKSGNNWLAFGLYKFLNDATSNEKQKCWCALRFTSPMDMVKSLTANIVIRKNQEFSLRSVSFNDELLKVDKKKLKNYKHLKATKGNGGILRIGKNFDLIGIDEDDANIFARNTYNVAAVVAMTLIKDCWSWTSYDVWDILKISQKSFSERVDKFEHFFIKFGTTTIKLKDVQTDLWEKRIGMELSPVGKRTRYFDGVEKAVKGEIKTDSQIERAMKSEVKTEGSTDDVVKREEKFEYQIDKSIKVETDSDDPLTEEKVIIEGFLSKFEKHRHPNAILRSQRLHLGFWKKDGAYFMFDLRDADKAGVCTSGKVDKSACPYVGWFDSVNGLLEHIYLNLDKTESAGYEFITFKLKAKIVNSIHKTWYNFSLVDDLSEQWMIRSLYGNLHYQCGVTSCVIALVFASTLQPANWNSSMLDSVIKYGMKLYKKSIKTNIAELKLNTIVTPFIIGCYEFSFTTGLLKCGANEPYVLENAITSLFSHEDFGVISSKGYSASIWQQNNSYFIFDPQLNGMASLSRYANITQISDHFQSHVRTGMTGVNVFEIFKISISSKMVKKNDCPVDIEAISKLTRRPTLEDGTKNSMFRMMDTISDNVKWLEVGKSLPTECVLIAACVLGCYKNPEYWTSNMTDEILSLGENIYQTTMKRLNLGNAPIKLDQIQGVYPCDARSAVQIRIQLFQMDGAGKQINVADAGHSSIGAQSNEIPKSVLTEFFRLHDNAFLSSTGKTNVTLTTWKLEGRFYLFSCQPIDIDGQATNINQSKGVLLPFENLYELRTFLETNFGDGNDVDDWLEIKSLEIDWVPIECLVEANQNSATLTSSLAPANTCSSTLTGDLCMCSSGIPGHLEKHGALSLAAIIMSTICDMKTWTDKILHKIEVYGCVLHRDARMYKVTQVTIYDFPSQFYIDHVEYKLVISPKSTDHNMDEKSLIDAMTEEFKGGPTLFFCTHMHSFCVIQKNKIFYWYDPNGVEDPKKEIRASVDCFSSMELLVSHILKIGQTLQSSKFTVHFIRCRPI